MQLLTHQLLERVRTVDVKNIAKELVPTDKVEDGQKVLGVLPDYLKRLYVAMALIGQEIKDQCTKVHAQFIPKVMAGAKVSDLPPEELAIMRRHSVEHDWLDQMGRLFWVEVSNEFPELAKDGINKGLREGWQVVSWEDEGDGDGLPAGLLGGLIIMSAIKRSHK